MRGMPAGSACQQVPAVLVEPDRLPDEVPRLHSQDRRGASHRAGADRGGCRERVKQDLVPAAQPIDLASMRPVGERCLPSSTLLPSGSCSISVMDTPSRSEIEPELYALLEWLAEQSVQAAEKRRRPEEIGRQILGYRDATRHVELLTARSGLRSCGSQPSTAARTAK